MSQFPYFVVVVQLLSHVWLFENPWTAARWAPLFFTISWSLLKFMFTEINDVIQSSYLLSPLLFLPSIFPSIRVFSYELALPIKWPSIGASASVSVPLMNIQDGFFFRMDWFDLLAVQGIQKFIQHYSSKASILWCSVFFMVQLSHPYMTTGKAVDLWAECKYWGNDNGSVCYGLHSHLHSLQPFHQTSCFGSWIECSLRTGGTPRPSNALFENEICIVKSHGYRLYNNWVEGLLQVKWNFSYFISFPLFLFSPWGKHRKVILFIGSPDI